MRSSTGWPTSSRDRAREIEAISNRIFRREMDERRIPAARLTAMLTRIGRAQSLLAKIRETAVSTSRLLSFLGGSAPVNEDANAAERKHLAEPRDRRRLR